MKTPKPIKAIAVVNKNDPKLRVVDIYAHSPLTLSNVHLEKDERFCEVEVKFSKFIK